MKTFNYDILKSNNIVREGKWAAFSQGSFYQLMPQDFDEKSLSGWKSHLSIDEKDVGRAWDALLPVIQKHELPAKVATPETAHNFSNVRNPQKGKMITLYFGKEEQYNSLLEEINDTLERENIAPGHSIEGDKKLNRYIYYRNDRDPNGQYADAASLANKGSPHNPFNAPDPMENIEIGSTTSRLNVFAESAGVKGRWTHHARAGRPNTHIQLPKEEAERVRQALNEHDIPAFIATNNGRSFVVLTQEEQNKEMSPESFTKAADHFKAATLQNDLQKSHLGLGLDWNVDAGKGASGAPNLRAVTPTAEDAHVIAQQMGEAGIPAQAVKKGDAFMVRVMGQDIPEDFNLAPNQQTSQNRSQEQGFNLER